MKVKFGLFILTILLSISVISNSIANLHFVSHESNEDAVVTAQEIVLDNHAITERFSLIAPKVNFVQNKLFIDVITNNQTIFSPIPQVSVDFKNNQMKHICAVFHHSSSYL